MSLHRRSRRCSSYVTRTINSGPARFPSVVRDCRDCGDRVWVSMLVLPEVEAGRLWTCCWGCYVLLGGGPLKAHPAELAWMEQVDLTEEGQEILDELNARYERERAMITS